MNDAIFLIIFILYGWVMFYLGSLDTGGSVKAKVAETSDKDPRP